MVTLLGYGATDNSLRHTHAGRSQHLITPAIPVAEFVEHHARLCLIGLDRVDGFVQRRVKWFTNAFVGYYTLRLNRSVSR